MGRPKRIEYPGAVYHVTSRKNAGGVIYKDDQDIKAGADLNYRDRSKCTVLIEAAKKNQNPDVFFFSLNPHLVSIY